MGQGFEKFKVKFPERKQYDQMEKLNILIILMSRWTMALNNLVNSLTTSFYKAETNEYLDLPTLQEK